MTPADAPPPMVEVAVLEATETLMPDVRRDVSGDEEDVHRVPAGMVEAYERAVKAVYDVGAAIYNYTRGAAAPVNAGPLPPGTFRLEFGDPRWCWNPVRHRPHRFVAEDRDGRPTSSYMCDGYGDTAAHALGYHHKNGAA